ncbi:uncharacterized protein Tco025E_04745 [Trypanosoma conorhini]|uniref:Transmembrane protein n=1 Tax=Trypanosoma conorhini TaxID=83891 RepID=A0A3R7MMX7_9TRYP|nr:uncharacterized protein Tco025E_04745 [Trypanosoma conorhini]RNF17838.1 hypothetical protein Tco025E_04745 [Trypanosoma conorhini]
MLRCSPQCLLFSGLGRTKLGAEVLMKTRCEMREMSQSDNRFFRFLTRRRPIDYLALEVDGPVTRELHPSFRIMKNVCTFLLVAPVFALLVTGVLSPSYYVLVPTGLLTADQFERMWEFSHWAVVLAGQLCLFLVFYDLTVYVRYPLFSHVLAPFYRRMGWRRSQLRSQAKTLDELQRRRPHARPLGVPLSEAKRASRDVRRPDPFGGRQKKRE